MWWALAAATGAQALGKDTLMPGGNTWSVLALNSYKNVWDQQDAVCGGGIYWSRDRNAPQSNQRTFKSLITQAQYMSLSMKMHSAAKSQVYLDRFNSLSDWLIASKQVIGGTVLDGLDTASCSLESTSWTYTYGMLISAYSNSFELIGNRLHLTRATEIFAMAMATFAPNNIITESCEEAGCSNDARMFKGLLIRSLKELYRATDDADVKTRIRTIVDANINAMAAVCDAQFNCSRFWKAGRMSVDVHSQAVALELVTTAIAIYAPTNIKTIIKPDNMETSLALKSFGSLLMASLAIL